jgi:hypothetical protein
MNPGGQTTHGLPAGPSLRPDYSEISIPVTTFSPSRSS